MGSTHPASDELVGIRGVAERDDLAFLDGTFVVDIPIEGGRRRLSVQIVVESLNHGPLHLLSAGVRHEAGKLRVPIVFLTVSDTEDGKVSVA